MPPSGQPVPLQEVQSSPKQPEDESLPTERNNSGLNGLGKEPQGLPGMQTGRLQSLPWAASVCILYSTGRRGEGLSSQAGSHASLRDMASCC